MKTLGWMVAQLTFFTALSAQAGPWEIVGAGYSSAKNPNGTPVFKVEKKSRIENNQKESELAYLGEKGEVLSVERYTTTLSGKLIHYAWEQKQTGKTATVDLTDTSLKIHFNRPGEEPKTDVTELKPGESEELIVPPMMDERIPPHWNDLKEGKQFEFAVIIPDRLDSFHFRFTSEKPKYETGPTFMLRASSFFLSLAVAPMPFHFSKDQKLLRVENMQTPVKEKSASGSWETVKTDLIFTESPQSAKSPTTP